MPRISNRKILPWLLLSALCLTACGNKGDLYLPPEEDNIPAQNQPSAAEKTPTTPSTTDEVKRHATGSPPDFPVP